MFEIDNKEKFLEAVEEKKRHTPYRATKTRAGADFHTDTQRGRQRTRRHRSQPRTRTAAGRSL